MSAKKDNLQRSYAVELSEFDSRLRKRVASDATIADLDSAIRRMLSDNSDSESDIRAILHKRLQDGHIHDETFRLVLGILDKVSGGQPAGSPAVIPLRENLPEFHPETTIVPSATTPNELVDSHVQVGALLRDRFQLEQRVAGGSIGVVYKARDRRLAEAGGMEPWVAIKVLNPELSSIPNAVRALQQEGAKARCLSHDNIARFIDIDRHDDCYFVVMEWLEGRSLGAVLNAGKGAEIDKSVAMDIMRQVSGALDYAHRCGVVHGDIKPSNIVITESGTVKLIDFGMARVRQQQLAGDPAIREKLERDSAPVYSSMQVLTGETPVPADDVFSLGCLMYRLLAGYRVYGPRNAAAAAEAGMAPQRPQGVDDREWRALKKALSIARVSRYPAPKDFLQAMSATQPITVTAEDTMRPVPALPEKRSWPLATIGLLFVLGALALARPDLVDKARDTLDSFVAGQTVQDPHIPVADDATVPAPPGDRVAERPASDSARVEAPPVATEPTASAPGAVPAVADMDSGVESAAVPLEPFEPVDYSSLPPADIIVPLASDGTAPVEVDLTLMEDGDSAIVDLVRDRNINLPLLVDFDEIGFSGNRSPWQAGQYQVADNGVIAFAAGQARARTRISMRSDPLREPDRQVTLLLSDGESAAAELAVINLRLEDDDQRRFEASLPTNTIAFAVSRVSVRESDPAAQIDILRFKPGDQRMQVGYQIRGVTATEGEDFFQPRSTVVTFAAGQRSARILIPLVQDIEVEGDEAFMLELIVDSSVPDSDLFRRIAVMIRDDDEPGR
ncbi:MAG: protein kinase [Gammaproteobacteria bacterium]|nr:protein kinase [Gammaproteobacteria bacterium]